MRSKITKSMCSQKDKKYYKDHPIPKVLNEMKYDVFVLGNHEFNFGMKALDEILKDIKAKKLTANFYYKKNEQTLILMRQPSSKKMA